MNRIDLKPAATLREPAELVAHGLVPVVDLPIWNRSRPAMRWR